MSGGWYNGVPWKEREAKLKEQKRLIAAGAIEEASGPCMLCGDPDVPVEYHTEDYSQPYSQPYSWVPPAEFVLCTHCHRFKLHKRFTQPGKELWLAFLAHVRRGGYARDLKEPGIKKEFADYRSGKLAESDLRPLNTNARTGTSGWFETLASLSTDPAILCQAHPVRVR